jgi:hypothetical protein
MAPLEETDPQVKSLRKTVEAFRTYMENNGTFIPNDGERYRCGKAIATGFVESAVVALVWLCVLLHWVWPSDRATAQPTPP